MLTAGDRVVVGFRDGNEYLCASHARERYGALAVSRAEVGLSSPPVTAVYGWMLDWDDSDDDDDWGSYCDRCGEPFARPSATQAGEERG